jgi:hypothetical protein
MKSFDLSFTAVMALALIFAQMASAADLYVATNGTGNGTSWADATNSIQGAIDAISGAYTTNTVWVSNGVYAADGVTNYPSGTVLTNRIAIYKAITVRSANNDPTNTIITGAKDTVGGTPSNGPAAVRCVYMINGSSLIGFMLTNGASLLNNAENYYAGGIWCQSTNTVISNCIIAGNMSSERAGGVYRGTLYNCFLVNSNSSKYGGGAYGGTLYNCSIIGNSANAAVGGGAYYCSMYNCTIISNSAYTGGGLHSCTVYNSSIISNSASIGGGVALGSHNYCMIIGNSAWARGGGADISTLSNCTLIGNSSGGGDGGGAYGSKLYNCLLVSNSAVSSGGAIVSILVNCTVVSNSATSGTGSGGIYASTNWNCIIYFNKAPNNPNNPNWYSTCVFTNCCTTPSNAAGWAVGNITNNPMFVDPSGNYHLAQGSPCINAGLNQSWMDNAFDLDGGHHRIDGFSHIVDMGCYENLPSGTMYHGF